MARNFIERRKRRKRSIRNKLRGTADRPRLTVSRSNRHIYAQVIDDTRGTTLLAASSLTTELKKETAVLKKKEQAKKLGMLVAEKCKEKGIEKVAFDRNGYLYHGRIAALADGAREGGLRF